ncbi:DUF134 domain-containing protein [Aeromonas schubertii]|uniref:UPF0251 protein LA374_08770 n=1 Tax=Aeromonas schubertii TaxID=652 RepID=A0ABS7VB30_9GAMM|nr:DUF134 domain-containing protein [Aeromonas schubertii]MBZ6066300.1 DUF134 domain-containing protein [Aeromonas schubertii]
MPRPRIPRHICGQPAHPCFKPSGTPLGQLERITLADDEYEALRLVDLQGMQQQDAAVAMGVSRQTLANMLKSARFKVVSCLSEGKALMMQRQESEQEPL